jgi:hypothetical protein
MLPRERKMGKTLNNKCYVATCKHGFTVYGSIANTPIEQADCARDIKRLTKQGFNLELLEPGMEMPDWCESDAKCKKCPLDRIDSELDATTPDCKHLSNGWCIGRVEKCKHGLPQDNGDVACEIAT